jgi:hypothetical protein
VNASSQSGIAAISWNRGIASSGYPRPYTAGYSVELLARRLQAGGKHCPPAIFICFLSSPQSSRRQLEKEEAGMGERVSLVRRQSVTESVGQDAGAVQSSSLTGRATSQLKNRQYLRMVSSIRFGWRYPRRLGHHDTGEKSRYGPQKVQSPPPVVMPFLSSVPNYTISAVCSVLN